MSADTVRCPRCGGRSIPIAHGLPGPELFETASTRCEHEWLAEPAPGSV